jgi:uncharacterized protein YegL
MRINKENKKIIVDTAGQSKAIIHIVHILDGSGSMRGGKFEAAVEGMKEEIAALKLNKEVEYLYTIVEFDYRNNIQTICNRVNINDLNIDYLTFFPPTGCTALYDAIGQTLTNILDCRFNEKVLVKIFTDGGENDSVRFSSIKVASLIKTCEELGYVITFVGTKDDTDLIVRNIKINVTNTLNHDNTTRGVKAAYTTSNAATIMYSKSVVAGTDSNIGFFNQENNNKK